MASRARNPVLEPARIGMAHSGEERHDLARGERLGPNDELVEMEVSHKARNKDPTLPRVFLARAIRYQRKGFPRLTMRAWS
jgi:hypothetical protein